jgi:hypothetical protein
MKRSGNGPSVGWSFASIAFQAAPGIGWRLHMSKIALVILPVRAAPRRWRR